MKALQIYYIPCIKHIVAMCTAAARLFVSLPFAVGEPYNPLHVYDLCVILFVLSALHHELRQMRIAGLREYLETDVNKLDVFLIVMGFACIALRIIASLTGLCPYDSLNITIGNLNSEDGNFDFSFGARVDSCHSSVMQLATENTSSTWDWLVMDTLPSLGPAGQPEQERVLRLIYRTNMAIFCIVQVLYLTRLMEAFETVGVMLVAITEMIYRVSAAFVPYILVAVAGSICFELFDSPDRWLSPWRRFIGADIPEGAIENEALFVVMWVYTLAVDVTILNMMIAIMTDTYFKVARGLAIARYRMSRVGLVREFSQRYIAPQPFDVVILFCRLLLSLLCLPVHTSQRMRYRASASSSASAGVTAQHESRSRAATEPIKGQEKQQALRMPSLGNLGRQSTTLRSVGRAISGIGSKFFDAEKLFEEVTIQMDVPAQLENTDDAENHHIVSRAQLEYLNYVRRRDQKEHDKEVASERIVDLQDELKKQADRGEDTTQLLLQMRLELLEQRNSNKMLLAMLQSMVDGSGKGARTSDVQGSPTIAPSPGVGSHVEDDLEEKERLEQRAALREVEKAAAKDLVKETLSAARRKAKLGKWRKSAHGHAMATSTALASTLERQSSSQVNQPEALAAVESLSAGALMPERLPSIDKRVSFGDEQSGRAPGSYTSHAPAATSATYAADAAAVAAASAAAPLAAPAAESLPGSDAIAYASPDQVVVSATVDGEEEGSSRSAHPAAQVVDEQPALNDESYASDDHDLRL